MTSKKLNILIVEDEYLIASGIAVCIEELGHNLVGVAGTGAEAMEIVGRTDPDIILMDINLPGMDGIEVMAKINESRRIPCIFITGYSDSGLIARAQSPFTYGYLIKPVDISDLRAAINVAMSRFEDYSKVSNSLDKATKALEERKTIERAKGIVMDLLGLKETQAMQYLQKKSRNSNVRVIDIARKIIEINGK